VVVVDASALVDFLTNIEGHPRIGRILMVDPGALHAPEIIDLEVLSAFREMVFDKRLDAGRASGFLVDFEALPIERHSHEDYVRRIWELRDNINPYDAAYVALAERLNVPLLTRDARLARSSGHAARIEYID
jgi:predicted nucleic acid-binding protein